MAPPVLSDGWVPAFERVKKLGLSLSIVIASAAKQSFAALAMTLFWA
jgi:hypothetical protein